MQGGGILCAPEACILVRDPDKKQANEIKEGWGSCGGMAAAPIFIDATEVREVG